MTSSCPASPQAFYSWARDIAVVNCDSGIFIDK